MRSHVFDVLGCRHFLDEEWSIVEALVAIVQSVVKSRIEMLEAAAGHDLELVEVIEDEWQAVDPKAASRSVSRLPQRGQASLCGRRRMGCTPKSPAQAAGPGGTMP